jgi:hypothetical protein
MKRIIILLSILLIFTYVIISTESDKSVVVYEVDGNQTRLDFDQINSFSFDLVDSLSTMHVYYKDNINHFTYFVVDIDSVWFDHDNDIISVETHTVNEEHRIEDIKYIKINCIRLIFPHIPEQGFHNKDSVMIDYCKCKGVVWYDCKELYAKTYYVWLPYEAIHLPYYPADTTVYIEWSDIDSSFQELRTSLMNLDSLFGYHTIIKQNPSDTAENVGASKIYRIDFSDYYYVDSVVNYLSTIEDLEGFLFSHNFSKEY